MRKTKFIIGEYYHIFNRGVDKRDIFLDKKDYERFLFIMEFLNTSDVVISVRDLKQKLSFGTEFPRSLASVDSKEIVEIVCFCLNPNHFHFILRQTKENGISNFMQKIGTSYTKYFNTKNKRSGSLFQGPFKSIHIDSNEYLLYLSVYVNCNNFIHRYNKNIKSWPYTSYFDYIGEKRGKLCKKEIILDQFGGIFKNYKNFCQMNAEYLKDKKEFQKYFLE
jgi:putative transposase